MKSAPMHLDVVAGSWHEMDHFQLHGRRWMRRHYLGVDGTIAHLLLRLLEVPDNGRDSATTGSRLHLWISGIKGRTLKRMQILVGKKGRLTNPLPVQQPESAVKRRVRRSGLLEQVGLGP